MALDNTSHDKESDLSQLELNLNLYEGLSNKAVNEVPQQMSSAERRDLANLGLRKGKKQLPRSLDASFDLGTASAPVNTRSKDKEGPSTTKKDMEGSGRKEKERTTLAGTKQSHESDIKEQVREHLKRKKEKK